jgi:hypothetical protein
LKKRGEDIITQLGEMTAKNEEGEHVNPKLTEV